MGELVLAVATYLVIPAGMVLVLVLGRPPAIERRGRNAWVGIRIPSTMASDAAWKAGHRAAWPMVQVACWVGIASGFAAVALVLSGVSTTVVFGGWVVTSLATLALMLMGARIADRTAKDLAQTAR